MANPLQRPAEGITGVARINARETGTHDKLFISQGTCDYRNYNSLLLLGIEYSKCVADQLNLQHVTTMVAGVGGEL